MANLVFVTSNEGKISSTQKQFKEHCLELDWFNHDCSEPDINDVEYISKYKVLETYSLIQKPCFVVDSGFYIDDYPDNPGFPGAFSRRLITDKKNGIIDLLIKM